MPTTQVTGLDVVTSAQLAVGTPFAMGGRVPGVAMDCIGLIIWVCRDLGLGEYDNPKFHQYYNPPRGLILLEMKKHATEVPVSSFQEGDALVFRIGRSIRHIGIASHKNRVIHTHGEIGQVVEHFLGEKWSNNLVAAFRLPGVD